MNNYKFLFSCVLTMSFLVNGQINTYSPYSYFGLGELHIVGNTHNISMGGLGVSLSHNTNLNYLNPAAYSFLDQTSFDFGIKMTSSSMSQYNLNQNNFVSGLSNIGLGFPISNNVGCAVSLSPYSSVGYSIISNTIINNDNESIETTSNYIGSGGVNQFSFGFGWKITNHLSIGCNLNYLFGAIDRETILFTNNSSLYFMERINKIINGFNPEIGLLYTHWMNDYKFNIGLNIKPEAQIRSKKNILHSTYSGPIYNPDTDYVIFEEEFFNDMITLPFESSLGLSVEFNEQWLIGLDYNHINWINYSDNGQNTSYITNKNEFILGGEFTPKKEDIYNYFNRVKYRFGVGYSSGYLDLSNMTNLDQPEMMLQEISCNIGLGLPINKVVSMAHIGLRWSMRGYNLSDPFIKENHLSFYLSMTLNEKWFNKRKIE